MESSAHDVPPFPWESLRALIFLGGIFAGNTRAKPVIGGQVPEDVRWQSIAHPERTLVGKALIRAFWDNRARYNMTAAHWKIFMACEVGLVARSARPGSPPSFVLYDPDHPNSVMPDEEAARTFDITLSRVPRYHREARRAIESEWRYLHSGYEIVGEDTV